MAARNSVKFRLRYDFFRTLVVHKKRALCWKCNNNVSFFRREFLSLRTNIFVRYSPPLVGDDRKYKTVHIFPALDGVQDKSREKKKNEKMKEKNFGDLSGAELMKTLFYAFDEFVSRRTKRLLTSYELPGVLCSKLLRLRVTTYRTCN